VVVLRESRYLDEATTMLVAWKQSRDTSTYSDILNSPQMLHTAGWTAIFTLPFLAEPLESGQQARAERRFSRDWSINKTSSDR